MPELGLVSKWRQKERLKTTAVALVLCLNIGVDPPDVIKISPCARLECWVDPLSMQPPKALETIGTHQLECLPRSFLPLGHLCSMRGLSAAHLPCVPDISLSGDTAAGHCLQLHAVMAMLCCLSSLRLQTRLTCVRGKHASDVVPASLAGKNLQAQYERWQPRAKYKTHLDPTMDDVKKLAISCRRTAKVRAHLCHYCVQSAEALLPWPMKWKGGMILMSL